MTMFPAVFDHTQWHPITRAPGYFVSPTGQALSTRTGTPRVLLPARCGSRRCDLRISLPTNSAGDRRLILLGELVLETFVGARPRGCFVLHANGDRTDNRLVNISWGTRADYERAKEQRGTRHRGPQSPRWKGGKPHCACGKVVSYDHRMCRACAEKLPRHGEHSPKWRGDAVGPIGARTRARNAFPLGGTACQRCGIAATLRHHRDRHPTNNRPENIEFLCTRCHNLEHNSERLEAVAQIAARRIADRAKASQALPAKTQEEA